MKKLINAKSKTDLSGFYIVYHGSTMLERPGIYGISHLMEHLMCKNYEDLEKNFEEDGIISNAYTSSDVICFHITGLDQYVNKYKYILYERLKSFEITQEKLDKEKKIVLEEYKDYFNKQNHAHILNLARKVYGDYDAIGQKESIEAITLQDCQDFFDLQFRNPQIVNISKKNNFVLDSFGIQDVTMPTGKLKLRQKEDVTYEILNEFKEKTSIVMLSPIVNKKDAAIANFICVLFGDGLQSPLYKEIREEKGLVYYLWCFVNQINENGSVIISSETSNDNVDDFSLIAKKVLGNKKKYITQERFDIVKKGLEIDQIKHGIERYNYPSKFISPPNWSYEKLFKQKDFNLQKVYEICDKYFAPDKFYVSIDKEEDFNNK